MPDEHARSDPRLEVLRRTQMIAGGMEDVFGFFEEPRNLELITPPWLHFNVLSTSDAEVREGTEIEYRLRWQIFPIHWKSRIAEYVRGEMFADEMLEGPYRHWFHRHFFEQTPAGVLMTDEVEYVLPFGALGDAAHSILIRRQLEQIFDYRRSAIEEIFASSPIRQA
jgi:ligand-binding SRPBCC domain-containing protein